MVRKSSSPLPLCARAALLVLGLAASGFAQERAGRWLDVVFPRDSPLSVVSYGLGEARERERGMTQIVSLHTSLVLRNLSPKVIRGVTLRVEADGVRPAGVGAVTLPSLNVAPGETFPARIDLELARPGLRDRTIGALVLVTVDCVLFQDLSAYGPNKLDARRMLTIYELEARRDRRYYQELVRHGETAQLREEMNFGLVDVRPPAVGFQLFSVTPPAQAGEQPVRVSAIVFPEAPVQPLSGAARLFANEMRAPRVELKNTSERPVRAIALGWILRDDSGRDFVAGATPTTVSLGPVQRGQFNEPGVLRFSHSSGKPMLIGGVSTFISTVEFGDGGLWIPSRADIRQTHLDPAIQRAIWTSPEQQRLAEIYRRSGLPALIAELKKFE